MKQWYERLFAAHATRGKRRVVSIFLGIIFKNTTCPDGSNSDSHTPDGCP